MADARVVFFFLSIVWPLSIRSGAGGCFFLLCRFNPWRIFCKSEEGRGDFNKSACRIYHLAVEWIRLPLAGRGGEEMEKICCSVRWVVLRPVLSVSLFSPAGRGGVGGGWWRLEVRLLLGVLRLVSFFAVSAPAGRGGEGSVRLEVGAVGGGSGRHGGGWVCGGSGKTELWPSSFNETRFRRKATDGSCGLLQWWWFSLPDGLRYGDSGVG